MTYEPIQFKVIDVKIKSKKKNSDSPYILYTVECQHEGNQYSTLGYFYHRGEVILETNKIYRAKLKPKTEKYNAGIIDPVEIENFDGSDTVVNPFNRPREPLDEYTEFDAKMEAWGDIHSAAPIVAAKISKIGNYIYGHSLVNDLVNVALFCKDARIRLSDQYYKELKANGKANGGEK